jgi:hypothetical protein
VSTPTKREAVKAAMSVAEDIAEGRLDPATVQQQAVTEMREMFGSVVGEGDPLWTLHADVARQAIGLGALSADELSEWAAVMRHKAGEAVEPPAPPLDPLPAVCLASVDESGPESTDDEDGAPEPAPLQGVSVAGALAALASAAQQAHATPAPQRRADGGGYDPLAGFNPGATRRY